MNEYLSSASLKSLAKGQLLGKYGILIGAYVIHIGFVFFVTLLTTLLIDGNSILGNVISYAVSFIVSLLSGLLIFGECYIYLKLSCNQKIAVKDLFYAFSQEPDKILKVQIVLSLITLICGLPMNLVSYCLSFVNGTSYEGNPYLLLASVLLMLGLCITRVILTMAFSQCYYLILDFPAYSAKEALANSYKIMKGNKGRLFYLCLSFIPLFLLGFLTCGIGFLWILPYYQAAKANFYLDLVKKH